MVILCCMFLSHNFLLADWKNFTCFLFLLESGNVCSSEGLIIDGSCYMSVKSNHPNACQNILQNNSHPAYIKSDEEQNNIQRTFLFLGIHDYLYYRIGIVMENSFTLKWEDGTPVVFESFVEDSSMSDLSENGDYCSVLDLLNNLAWEIQPCTSSETQTGTLCQLGGLKYLIKMKLAIL